MNDVKINTPLEERIKKITVLFTECGWLITSLSNVEGRVVINEKYRAMENNSRASYLMKRARLVKKLYLTHLEISRLHKEITSLHEKGGIERPLKYEKSILLSFHDRLNFMVESSPITNLEKRLFKLNINF